VLDSAKISNNNDSNKSEQGALRVIKALVRAK